MIGGPSEIGGAGFDHGDVDLSVLVPLSGNNEIKDGTFELVVAGRELDNGDVAVMMVEAGGSENAFYYYDDGAKKVTEEVLADGLDACKVWIKESIGLQRQLVASVIATNGPIEPMNRECRPLRSQVPLGPARDRAMIAPLRPLRTQAVRLVPDRVLTHIGDQRRFRRLFGKDLRVVIKV